MADSISKVNTILLRNAMFFARNLLLQTTQSCEGDEFIKKDFLVASFSFNPRILSLVINYAEFNHPVDREAMLKNLTDSIDLEEKN